MCANLSSQQSCNLGANCAYTSYEVLFGMTLRSALCAAPAALHNVYRSSCWQRHGSAPCQHALCSQIRRANLSWSDEAGKCRTRFVPDQADLCVHWPAALSGEAAAGSLALRSLGTQPQGEMTAMALLPFRATRPVRFDPASWPCIMMTMLFEGGRA